MKDLLSFLMFLLSIILMILMVLIIYDKLDELFNEPIVYYSNSSGECVKIETSEGFLPCSRIKDFKTYSHYWVK